MESSYKKLAKLKQETIYQVKKALEQRRIHEFHAITKLNEGKDEKEVYAFENLQNALTLNDLLAALVKLYEIE